MLVAGPSQQGRRVAVTGIGTVAPCGVGNEAFFNGLFRPFDDVVERKVTDLYASALFDPKEIRRADRFTQMAVMAADEALRESGDLQCDPTRVAVYVGTGVGGLETLEAQIVNGHEKGLRRVTPFLVPMMMNNAAAGAISMRWGFHGRCETTVTACAAGTHSVTNAARLVATGEADVVVAGSAEAPQSPTGVAAFRNMTALSKTGISHPFGADRDGFCISEGAGILILEEWEHALRRGATIHGEILGGASTADAHHITAPSPGGVGAVNCMTLSLADAGLSASDITHINAHGTSTPLNDAAEAEAVAKVFGEGEDSPLVVSTKGVTGHALGAAGSMEAAAVLLCMRHGKLPPTMGTVELDPELPGINLVVGEAREWKPGPSLSNSFGFGGHNGTVVIGPPT